MEKVQNPSNSVRDNRFVGYTGILENLTVPVYATIYLQAVIPYNV
jgi:hypothetical protein